LQLITGSESALEHAAELALSRLGQRVERCRRFVGGLARTLWHEDVGRLLNAKK
jgi:hypothetical protein